MLKFFGMNLILTTACLFVVATVAQKDYLFRRIPLDYVAVPTPEDPDADGIIGIAGKDYPVLKQAPVTSFACDGHIPGMYADVETGCQVYHVCQADLRKESVLCVNGTIFNQESFSCDWWYNVDCPASPKFYSLNSDLGKPRQSGGVQSHKTLSSQRGVPLARHPQLLRRKSPAYQKEEEEPVPLPPPPPPPIALRPDPLAILKSIPSPPPLPVTQLQPVPLFSPPSPPTLSLSRKKLRRPVEPPTLSIPEIPNFPGPPSIRLPPLPSVTPTTGRLRPTTVKPRRPSATPFEGQYVRDAFDPVRHLPKPKPVSSKKLTKQPSQRLSSSKNRMAPMMQPVQSDDTLSGYSDLYLNKPVDED